MLLKRKTSISKKGNVFIRKALFMPAFSVCRTNPQMKNLYQRLVTKAKKLAIIAVARKLLLLIYTLCKSNSPYIQYCKPVQQT
jgi:transposase